jgi:hypothetical protein
MIVDNHDHHDHHDREVGGKCFLIKCWSNAMAEGIHETFENQIYDNYSSFGQKINKIKICKGTAM